MSKKSTGEDKKPFPAIVWVFVFFALAFSSPARAQNVATTSSATGTTSGEISAGAEPELTAASTAPSEDALVKKVLESSALLDATDLKYKIYTSASIYKKKKTYIKMLQREVAVTGFDQNTGELKKFIFEEKMALNSNNRPAVKPPKVIAEKDGCALTWNAGSRWGFNRDMSLACGGAPFIVTGIKMPYPASPSSSGIIVESYVPYSPALHTDAFIKIGKEYLEKVITEAGQELEKQDVKSRAFPDKKITEVVPSEFIMSIILDEHMDHSDFTKATKDGSFPKLVEKVWVIAGLNKEKAMRWSISSAGACCLTQFMPSTYKLIAKKYPEAQLDPKTSSGRQDHVNAVKASIVLFDSDISGGWKIKTKETCLSSADMLEKCLAASYNAGPGTLNKVIKSLGINWDTGPARKSRWAPRLKLETITYLKKLTHIKDYLVSLKN